MHHGKNLQDHWNNLQTCLFGTHQISIPSANFFLPPPLDIWEKMVKKSQNQDILYFVFHCVGMMSGYFRNFNPPSPRSAPFSYLINIVTFDVCRGVSDYIVQSSIPSTFPICVAVDITVLCILCGIYFLLYVKSEKFYYISKCCKSWNAIFICFY